MWYIKVKSNTLHDSLLDSTLPDQAIQNFLYEFTEFSEYLTIEIDKDGNGRLIGKFHEKTR